MPSIQPENISIVLICAHFWDTCSVEATAVFIPSF